MFSRLGIPLPPILRMLDIHIVTLTALRSDPRQPWNIFALTALWCTFLLTVLRALGHELLSTVKLTHFTSPFLYYLKR